MSAGFAEIDALTPKTAAVTPGWATFMVLQMVLWASSYPAVAIATRDLTGVELTAVRGIASAWLYLSVIAVAAVQRALPPWRDAWQIMAWGGWYFGLTLMCFNTSIEWGRPELSGVIFAGFPIVLAILAALTGIEPWDRRAVPYVLLALAGALIVVTRGDLSKIWVLTDDLRATGLMSLCLVMIAAYSLGSKMLLMRTSPAVYTALALLGGSIVLIIAMQFSPGSVWSKFPSMRPEATWSTVYLILVATVVTEWMSMTGLRALSVLHVGVFNYLQPPLIVCFSMLLPESRAAFGWPLGIGALLILCGASAVGTMTPDRRPWPEVLLRRLTLRREAPSHP